MAGYLNRALKETQPVHSNAVCTMPLPHLQLNPRLT